MNYLSFVKKYFTLSLLLGFSHLKADGIIGGSSGGSASAAIFMPMDTTSVTFLSPLPTGTISSVAINDFNQAIIGGTSSSAAYAQLVSSSKTLTPIGPLPPAPSFINSVAINGSGVGIIGGQNNSGFGYAARVSSSGAATTINTSLAAASEINAVAINDAGQALLGGRIAATDSAYAATAIPGATNVTVIAGLPSTSDSEIHDVALSGNGLGILGGENGVGDAFAATVTIGSSSFTPITPLPSPGTILAVAINDAQQILIGGIGALNNAYAARVVFGDVVDLSSSLPENGFINDIAINSSGFGVIGGEDVGNLIGYAALLPPSGDPISLDIPATSITSVSINTFNQAVIAGTNGSLPWAAIVDSNGTLVALNLSSLGSGSINSCAINNTLSQVPTNSLSGNSLILAKYLNANAPQLNFYLTPSTYAGTLPDAFKSLAPTRNMFGVTTASAAAFVLNNSFSSYSQATRTHIGLSRTREIVNTDDFAPDELYASAGELAYGSRWRETEEAGQEASCKYELWATALGSLAYQKAQHDTPAFNPTTGALIVGFDGKTSSRSRVGVGASYAFTHVHVKENAGWSNINQEFLFTYALWSSDTLFFDAALWAGLFQFSHVRKIHMTGFEFKNKSHPKGWQLVPHFEIGYDFNSSTQNVTYEPFIMFDWANNWQSSYKESGSPFRFGQKHHYSSLLRSELGTRFYQTIAYDTWHLVIEEKISYVNRKPFNMGNGRFFVVGAPDTFTVETLTTPQNLGAIELSFLFESNKPCKPYTFIDYKGEFGSMYQLHLLVLTLGWNF
ncbi:MAG: autotransporter domain-containing protein [Rhabdochlamydiaceae bacterium]|nr:autotransporter domain-containing protein [Rhabdochlamydiaceae bacterium]